MAVRLNFEGVVMELLDRLGAGPKTGILVTNWELKRWPAEVVSALQVQKLILKARLATSAVCPGCERECVMPVDCVSDQIDDFASFIVCDKRSDTNRVNVSADLLIQWRCSAESIARFIANCLSFQPRLKQTNEPRVIELGMATGNRRSQMLCLNFDGVVTIQAGSNRIVLADIVLFSGGRYKLDEKRIQRLVDSSVTADARHTPNTARREAGKLDTQAMYSAWKAELKKLRKSRPKMSNVWDSRRIAQMDIAQGREAETIRRKMTT